MNKNASPNFNNSKNVQRIHSFSSAQAGEHKVTLKNYGEINLYNCTEKLVGKSNVI